MGKEGQLPEAGRQYFVNPQEEEAYRQDLERIRFQSEKGFNRPTDAFLGELGLSPQMTFLDLGCGGGEAWPVLLKHIGGVIAVDSDGKRLEAGKDIIEACDLKDRILPTKGDILHLSIPDRSMDGVYARLVLQHFTVEVRQEVMKEIARVLKNGGVAVLEDLVVFGTWKVDPPSEAFDRLLVAFEKTYQRRGTEPDMGLKLPGLARETGFTGLKVNPYQILSLENDPFKQAHLNILKTAARGIVGMGIMTQEEFQQNMAEFGEHLLNPKTAALSPTMIQLAAYK